MPSRMAPFFTHPGDATVVQVVTDEALPVAGILGHVVVSPVSSGHLEEHPLLVWTDHRKEYRRRFLAEFFAEPITVVLFDLGDSHRGAERASRGVPQLQIAVFARIPVAS